MKANVRPHVTIVIVSWNTRELLVNCLRSICEIESSSEQGIHFEILVVDNASTDGTLELEGDFPSVKFISNDDNIGFARANNQAFRNSEGDYVALLNPDTVVGGGALGRLVWFMEENASVGAVGPKVLNPDGSLQQSCYPSPTLIRECGRLFHLGRVVSGSFYSMEDWSADVAREVEIIQGCCLVVRRAALDQTGPLDEEFFIYSEDFDLCYRLRELGWTLFWVPTAEVVHLGGQSTRQNSGKMFLQLHRSKLQFFRKHHGRQKSVVYKILLGITAISRLAWAPIAWMRAPGARMEYSARSRNYWELLRALPEL